MLEAVVEPMLQVHDALREQHGVLHRQLLRLVRDDEVCRRLMTVPGVGPVVAMTYKTAIDDPARFGPSAPLQKKLFVGWRNRGAFAGCEQIDNTDGSS